MDKVIKTIKRWVRLLNPSPKVGGLEITDAALRYLLFDEKGGIKQAFLRLPSGIIEGGRVKNKQNLTEALLSLRKQITKTNKSLNVVVTVSAANVYTQVFNLPPIAEDKLEEATQLNLQMISPIAAEDSYYDSEPVGRGENKVEFLGAFVNAGIVDDLVESLESAGFAVAAVEAAPLSLARVVRRLSGLNAGKPYLALSLSGDGLDFFILRNGNLYFNHFISWSEVQEKEGGGVGIEAIKNAVVVELKRLLNFYTSRWGGLINDLILVSVKANKEIVTAVESNFKINIHELTLSRYPKLSSTWMSVVGAGLRGLMPRADDKLISLTGVGTEERFFQSRILGFASFWRNGVIAVLAALFLAYGVLDLVVINRLTGLGRQLEEAPETFKRGEITQLETEAREFNALVDKALAADEQSVEWSPFFKGLSVLAGANISLTQIQLQPATLSITLGGTAVTERGVINFKNSLIDQPNFEEVSLPLTTIKVEADGKAKFTVKFKLKKWPVQ